MVQFITLQVSMVNAPSALGSVEVLRHGHLKKHIATVFVRGTLGSLERRLWNLLTKNAYSRLHQERHEIPVSVLLQAANIRGNDRRFLKPALIKLRQTSIEWIRQSKSGELEIDSDWIESSFLSLVGVVNGMVQYEYTKFVREQLQDPSVYARIHVESQGNLAKGKALTLYEITARYRPNKARGFKGKTEVWTLEFFRAAMGAEAPLYNDFKNLNRKIIKPNVTKVNERTDIKLETVYHKQGRRCVGIQFLVRDNPQLPLVLETEDSEILTVRKRLVEWGIGEVQVDTYLKDYDPEYLREKIAFVEAEVKSGKAIKSVNGYLHKAILNDWKMVTGKVIEREQKKAVMERRLARAQAEETERLALVAAEKAQCRAEWQEVEAFLASLGKTERKDLDSRFELKMMSNSVSRNIWERREDSLYRAVYRGSWRQFVLDEIKQSSVPANE